MPDCPLCDISHEGGPDVCPELRTGETVLDKYAVGPLLGVGGMAAVYQVSHPILRREIALKILHKRFAGDAELGARFIREARETAGIGHPAFVGVHDAGTTEDGCAFIEMDRLEGGDLYALRKAEGALAIDRLIVIATAILDALVALHGRGVIHRDLKAANVFLVPGPDGSERVKLLDLGFAKVADDLQLTSPDALLGTPFYISPEQYVDPTKVDARADVFSLGIVLFEVLTGTWPYTYESKRDLLHKVMKGTLERHPASRRPEIPAWLDAIVARALALDREDRFASAAQMLEAFHAGAAPAAPEPAKPGFFKRLLKR
jgi:eukaryotic-like serine/threonine-protein kinase